MGHGRLATVRFAISVSTVLTLVVGCGGKTSDDGAATGAGGSTGGLGGSNTWPSTGGSVTTSGGNAAKGGSSTLITGGAVNAGGMAASGGRISSTGGKAGLGGAITTGGARATGGTASTGGKSSVGGAVSSGGKSGVGGVPSTGGSILTGGAAGTGGVGTGGVGTGGASSAGSAGMAGGPLATFCQGDKSKVLFQGRQEVLAPATSYQSSLVMDCCMAYGVNLHARDALGFDIAIETIWSGGSMTAPSIFTLGSSTARVRAEVRRSTDPITSYGVMSDGTVSVFSSNPFEVGLCLSLYQTAAVFYGTFIYVPKIALWSYQNRGRFQIFLLSDASITQGQAISKGLSAVALAANPILDLGRIAYVSSSASEIGFNPGQKTGESLQAAVKGSAIEGIPFVVVADSERITLGAFSTGASSIAYGLPTIFVENIKTDWLAFESGGGSSNPLTDPRIVATLTATGTLIP